MLIAIILAAGDGTRMGGAKAHLRVGGVTLLEQHVAAFRAIVDRVVVVVRETPSGGRDEQQGTGNRKQETGNGESERREEQATGNRQQATGSDADTGGARELVVVGRTRSQGESLAMAVRSVGVRDDDRVFVTPVDLLPPLDATLRALLGVDADAVTPVCFGRSGHPVLVSGRVLSIYREEAPALRDVLRALGERRVRVAVEDERVLGDFDLPGDLPG